MIQFPCPKCLHESRVKQSVCTFEVEETVIKRNHVCRKCGHEFKTEMKQPYIPTKEESVDLARRVKAQLTAMNLTQAQFAERSGIHIDTIKSWFSYPDTTRFRIIPAKYFPPLKEFCIKGHIFTPNRG